MKQAGCILLLMMLAVPLVAQDTSFWTKEQVVGQAANAGVRIWDIAQSCAHVSPHYREVGGPWQSCLGITAWSGAGIPLSMGMAYGFHRIHQDRLAKWTPWVWAGVSGIGIARSYHTYSLPRRGR